MRYGGLRGEAPLRRPWVLREMGVLIFSSCKWERAKIIVKKPLISAYNCAYYFAYSRDTPQKHPPYLKESTYLTCQIQQTFVWGYLAKPLFLHVWLDAPSGGSFSLTFRGVFRFPHSELHKFKLRLLLRLLPIFWGIFGEFDGGRYGLLIRSRERFKNGLRAVES